MGLFIRRVLGVLEREVRRSMAAAEARAGFGPVPGTVAGVRAGDCAGSSEEVDGASVCNNKSSEF